MKSDDHDITIEPGLIEIDANELAVRIYEAMSGYLRPKPDMPPEEIIAAMHEFDRKSAATVARIANTCVDYFGECIRGYARRV